MKTSILALAIALAFSFTPTPAAGGLSNQTKCDSGKLLAAAKFAQCRIKVDFLAEKKGGKLTADAKQALQEKCATKLTDAHAKLETKYPATNSGGDDECSIYEDAGKVLETIVATGDAVADGTASNGPGAVAASLCDWNGDDDVVGSAELWNGAGDGACVCAVDAAVRDCSNVCGGTDASCEGCDGIQNSGTVYDECGDCGGPGLNAEGCCRTETRDCNEVCGGGAVRDCAGECAGDATIEWFPYGTPTNGSCEQSCRSDQMTVYDGNNWCIEAALCCWGNVYTYPNGYRECGYFGNCQQLGPDLCQEKLMPFCD